jgi:hypothetical protein
MSFFLFFFVFLLFFYFYFLQYKQETHLCQHRQLGDAHVNGVLHAVKDSVNVGVRETRENQVHPNQGLVLAEEKQVIDVAGVSHRVGNLGECVELVPEPEDQVDVHGVKALVGVQDLVVLVVGVAHLVENGGNDVVLLEKVGKHAVDAALVDNVHLVLVVHVDVRNNRITRVVKPGQVLHLGVSVHVELS